MSRTRGAMLQRFRKSFLTVPVFVSRAYSELEALDANQYFKRSAPGSKELIDEILPLATLLKHLEAVHERGRTY